MNVSTTSSSCSSQKDAPADVRNNTIFTSYTIWGPTYGGTEVHGTPISRTRTVIARELHGTAAARNSVGHVRSVPSVFAAAHFQIAAGGFMWGFFHCLFLLFFFFWSPYRKPCERQRCSSGHWDSGSNALGLMVEAEYRIQG